MSAITASDVFGLAGGDETFNFRNLDHTSRLTVLHDKTIIMRPFWTNLGGVDQYGLGETKEIVDVHVKFKKPIKVLYSGSDANKACPFVSESRTTANRTRPWSNGKSELSSDFIRNSPCT